MARRVGSQSAAVATINIASAAPAYAHGSQRETLTSIPRSSCVSASEPSAPATTAATHKRSPFAEDESRDGRPAGVQGHAHADFAIPLDDTKGHDPVEPDGREGQREHGKRGDEPAGEMLRRACLRHGLCKRAKVEHLHAGRLFLHNAGDRAHRVLRGAIHTHHERRFVRDAPGQDHLLTVSRYPSLGRTLDADDPNDRAQGRLVVHAKTSADGVLS